MFFDDVAEIPTIASKCGTSVFVMPDEVEFELSGAIILRPEDKSVITIEQIRSVMARLNVRQVAEQFVLIRPADKLGDASSNALLKMLEEPGDKVHFVLVTDAPSAILPTVLSRANVYFLRSKDSGEIVADDKVKTLAKRLIVARGSDLVTVANDITKKKDGVRAYALSVVGVAIEMLYKSYYMTERDVFLRKLPKFLECYEGILGNGHIKLQIVASLC